MDSGFSLREPRNDKKKESGSMPRSRNAFRNTQGKSDAEPNGVRLAPKQSAEIVWKFTHAGTFEYSCLIPGHRDAGMVGQILVK